MKGQKSVFVWILKRNGEIKTKRGITFNGGGALAIKHYFSHHKGLNGYDNAWFNLVRSTPTKDTGNPIKEHLNISARRATPNSENSIIKKTPWKKTPSVFMKLLYKLADTWNRGVGARTELNRINITDVRYILTCNACYTPPARFFPGEGNRMPHFHISHSWWLDYDKFFSGWVRQLTVCIPQIPLFSYPFMVVARFAHTLTEESNNGEARRARQLRTRSESFGYSRRQCKNSICIYIFL